MTPESEECCWVYVVRDMRERNYVGIITRLRERIKEHNRGRTPADRGRGPFELVYKEPQANHAAARIREKYLKSSTGRRWLKLHLAGSTPPCSE